MKFIFLMKGESYWISLKDNINDALKAGFGVSDAKINEELDSFGKVQIVKICDPSDKKKKLIVIGNDHLGHGKSIIKDNPKMFIGELGSWNYLVKDINILYEIITIYNQSSIALLGYIVQKLNNNDQAFEIWTHLMKQACYIGDIGLYIITQKQALKQILKLKGKGIYFETGIVIIEGKIYRRFIKV